ncbi:MAG: PAS domain S-box protein [Verrucomicrobia bacterium]|nr:PAS domain S-box protein [Verrucomicrobiota bacterium]
MATNGTVLSAQVRLPIRAFFIAALVSQASVRSAAPQPPFLSRAEEIRRLTPEQAAQRLPVRIEGVVTYSDPDNGFVPFVVVQDESGGVGVVPRPNQLFPEAGRRVTVEGFAEPGKHLPFVNQGVLQDLGPGPMPVASRRTIPELITGTYDGARVEVLGMIRSLAERNGRLEFDLVAGTNRVKILVRRMAREASRRLLDAQVRVQGVCIVEVDAQKRPMAALIFAPHIDGVIVEQPGLENVFGLPISPIASVTNVALPLPNRVQVRGRISEKSPQGGFVIRDPTGTIGVQTRFAFDARIGDEIDAAGYRAGLPTTPLLDDCVLRLVGRPLEVSGSPVATPPTAAAGTNLVPLLTTAREVRALSSDEAARGYPVRLRAVVTYFNPTRPSLFVQDETGGIYVDPSAGGFDLKQGSLVEVEGFSNPGRFLSMIARPRIQVLGQGSLPVPSEAGLDTLASGRLDSQWVETRGVVLSSTNWAGELQIELADHGARTKVWIWGAPPTQTLTNLVDAEVRVRGVSATHFDEARRLVGFHLFTQGPDNVRLEKAPPPDAFGIPIRSIAQLLRFTPEAGENHRVKVSGVVTLQRPERLLFIQDQTGAVMIESNQSGSPRIGEQVEVVGFPVVTEFAPALQGALFRSIGATNPPSAAAIDELQALRVENHGRLVRLQGRLLDSTVRPDGSVLVLQNRQTMFPAFLGHLPDRENLRHLREGSLLEVTGVCVLDPANSQTPTTFRILLRSLSDVAVLKRPPWWALRYALPVIGGLSAVVVSALVWAYSLRRRVREQTEVIRRRLESETALEERYRELFENATDIVYTHDLEGRFLSINKAGERILGYSTEEIMGLDVFHVVAPEYREISRRMFERKLRKGGQTMYELQLVGKDGRRIWGEVSSRLILQDAKAVGVHGVIRDITERKRAEETLQTLSNLGHRLSAACTPKEAAETIIELAEELFCWDACFLHLFTPDLQGIIPVVHFDTLEGRRVPVSSGYVDMEPSRMDREVLANGKQLVLRETPGFEPESNLIAFGDKNRPSASLMFVPIRHGTEVIGVLSIQSYEPRAYDQNDLETLQGLADHCGGALERIRTTQAFEKSESRFHKAFQATPVSIAISRLADGRIADVNDGFLQLFGYAREEVIGRTGMELGIWAHPEERAEIIRQLRAQQTVRNRECRLRTKSGNILETLVSVELIDFGHEPCTLFITYDLSERFRLEIQLRQSQKMEAVGQLAAGIAHDFNNIMTIIQGHASLLLSAPASDGEATESLKKVLVATERASGLTRQLLTFSRKQVLQPKLVDLIQIIAGISKMLQRLLGENIVLESRYPSVLPAICADIGMVEQIILNLAVNARDAMPQGGRLTISGSVVALDETAVLRNAEARAGRFVCLSVADTGCGMEAKTLSKIFEPFFTTKEVGKGTGLGLSMVYGIVKQHRGWIEVTSQPGHGTRFDLFFPAESKTAEPPTPIAPAASSQTGTETILVVEDEPALRHLVGTILRRQGYQVLEARTGREALQIWRQHHGRVDLLLTDVVMPEGLSGVDLAEQLHAAKPSLKVIFTSGYSQDAAGQRVVLEEGVNFLPKPYHPSKLAQIVRDCLDSPVHVPGAE